MHIPDLINGTFEAVGAFATAYNIRTLVHQKSVRGYHFGPMLFFTSWSIWNCFYYPHLNQWISTAGGAAMGLSNVIYAVLTFHYLRQENKRERRAFAERYTE